MSIAAILDALIAIPKIADLVLKLASAIATWYCQRQTANTLAAIADAAAFAARATTDDERYQAAQKWRNALSSSRIIS